MKQLIILCILFVGLNSWSQSDSLKKDRKFFFKIVYAPLFPTESVNGKTVTMNRVYSYNSSDSYTYNKKKSNSNYSYEVFLMGEIVLNKKFNLDFGLGLKSMKFEIKRGTPIQIESYYQYMPFYSKDTTTYIQIEKEYSLFSFPILFNYKIKKNNHNFTVGLGASYDLIYNFRNYINGNIRSYNFDPKHLKRKMSYTTLILRLGYHYRFNRNFSLGVDPFFSYSFYNPTKYNSIKSDGFSEKIKLISLGTSFVIKF